MKITGNNQNKLEVKIGEYPCKSLFQNDIIIEEDSEEDDDQVTTYTSSRTSYYSSPTKQTSGSKFDKNDLFQSPDRLSFASFQDWYNKLKSKKPVKIYIIYELKC